MSKTKEEILEEYKKKEHEQEQLRHRMQRMENRKEYTQSVSRRNRTHRLITRGAAIESIVPEAKEMGERAFYLALEKFFDDENHRKSLCDEMSRQARIFASAQMVMDGDGADKSHSDNANEKSESPVVQKGGA